MASIRTLIRYALDPGFTTQFNSIGINELAYKVRWESIQAGPVGKYVEVIDIGPPRQYFYEPLNLTSDELLGQNVLPPIEGDPQSHDKMVYAVIMKTVRHFEYAFEKWRGEALSLIGQAFR